MRLLRLPGINATWLILSVITLVAVALGAARGSGEFTPSTAITVGVVAIAFVKAHLIIRRFMGVAGSPPWLRVLTGLWTVIVPVAILALYLM